MAAFQRLDVASGQTQVDSKQHLGQWSAAAEEQIGRLQRRPCSATAGLRVQQVVERRAFLVFFVCVSHN